jgi:serine/threonine protein kinase
MKGSGITKIDSFDLEPGRRIARKYEVVSRLGAGWEGEVYKIVEIRTGIERAAKLFYPHRNVGNRTSTRYAKKLHKLRQCPLLIQYHTEETFTFRRTPITVLVSEYVEGELLSEFLKKLPGKRLTPFEAVHLLSVLSRGIEQIHRKHEYHGDLHLENIIIRRYGLTFDVKVLDFYGKALREAAGCGEAHLLRAQAFPHPGEVPDRITTSEASGGHGMVGGTGRTKEQECTRCFLRALQEPSE